MTNPSEKLCIRWDDFKQNIVSSHREWHKRSDFTDITLMCKDNQHIKAHRLILASSSPSVSDFLKKNKHSNPIIDLTGFNKRSLMSIMDFIYCGEAFIYQEDLDGFLELAEKLQLKGLEGSHDSQVGSTEESIRLQNTLKPYRNIAPEEKGIHQSELFHDSGVNIAQYFDNNLVGSRNNVEKEEETKQSGKKFVDDSEDSIGKPNIPNHQDYNFLKEEMVHEAKSFHETHVPIILENIATIHSDKANWTVASDKTIEGIKAKIDSVIKPSFTNALEWTCTVCGKVAKSKSHIREHIESHITGLSYQCNQCDKASKTSAALRTHISSYHKE